MAAYAAAGRLRYAQYEIPDNTTQHLDRPGVAHGLPGISDRRCLGNVDLSGRAVSDRFLDRRFLSNPAPGFRMDGMAA